MLREECCKRTLVNEVYTNTHGENVPAFDVHTHKDTNTQLDHFLELCCNDEIALNMTGDKKGKGLSLKLSPIE